MQSPTCQVRSRQLRHSSTANSSPEWSQKTSTAPSHPSSLTGSDPTGKSANGTKSTLRLYLACLFQANPTSAPILFMAVVMALATTSKSKPTNPTTKITPNSMSLRLFGLLIWLSGKLMACPCAKQLVKNQLALDSPTSLVCWWWISGLPLGCHGVKVWTCQACRGQWSTNTLRCGTITNRPRALSLGGVTTSTLTVSTLRGGWWVTGGTLVAVTRCSCPVKWHRLMGTLCWRWSHGHRLLLRSCFSDSMMSQLYKHKS